MSPKKGKSPKKPTTPKPIPSETADKKPLTKEESLAKLLVDPHAPAYVKTFVSVMLEENAVMSSKVSEMEARLIKLEKAELVPKVDEGVVPSPLIKTQPPSLNVVDPEEKERREKEEGRALASS